MIGTWVSFEKKTETGEMPERKDGIFNFQKHDDNSYDLTYTEKDIPVMLRAYLVQLGKYKFLDVTLAEIPPSGQEPAVTYGLQIANNGFWAHVAPAHTFAKVSNSSDSLKIEMLNNGWMREMLKDDKIKLEHEIFRGKAASNEKERSYGIIITAKTKELQEFVLNNAENSEAFSNPRFELVRKTENDKR